MKVPVVDVTSENFTEIWPSLILAIKSATFAAIDTELSGLGDRRALNAKSLDDRYKTLSNVAKTRSVVSLGISTFKFLPPCEESVENKGANSGFKCLAQTFNITVLCQEDYIVEPEALMFLVDHGFDFNKQYSKGIPYTKGEDKSDFGQTSPSLRNLFSTLMVERVPVVFHNAFVDLGFLYENLYCPLPSTTNIFISDLTEIFPGGVYDTKYITEYVARYPASYLDYIFHKSYRDNAAVSNELRVEVSFLSYPESCHFVSYRECNTSDTAKPNLHPDVLQAMRGLVCSVFAAHGWCPRRKQCTKSHDIDLILDTEEVAVVKTKRKRKRKRHNKAGQKNLKTDESFIRSESCETNSGNQTIDHSSNDESETDDGEMSKEKLSLKDNCCSEDKDMVIGNGFILKPVLDTPLSNNQLEKILATEGAYQNTLNGDGDTMCSEQNGIQENISVTKGNNLNEKPKRNENNSKGHRAGFDFSMAIFVSRFGTKPKNESLQILANWGLDSLKNKVFLSGKDFPLSITQTNFSKTSKHHKEKKERLGMNV